MGRWPATRRHCFALIFIQLFQPNRTLLISFSPLPFRLSTFSTRIFPLCRLRSSSSHTSPPRKTQFTVEAVSLDDPSQPIKTWIGVNQTAANRYVEHFLRTGQFSRMFADMLREGERDSVKREAEGVSEEKERGSSTGSTEKKSGRERGKVGRDRKRAGKLIDRRF